MSRIRGGTMGAMGTNGIIPARSNRAVNGKLEVLKNQKPCYGCNNNKMFVTHPKNSFGQIKCTKCKRIQNNGTNKNKR